MQRSILFIACLIVGINIQLHAHRDSTYRSVSIGVGGTTVNTGGKCVSTDGQSVRIDVDGKSVRTGGTSHVTYDSSLADKIAPWKVGILQTITQEIPDCKMMQPGRYLAGNLLIDLEHLAEMKYPGFTENQRKKQNSINAIYKATQELESCIYSDKCTRQELIAILAQIESEYNKLDEAPRSLWGYAKNEKDQIEDIRPIMYNIKRLLRNT